MSEDTESDAIHILSSDDPLLDWRTVKYPGQKKVALTLGLGSGAFRHPDDPWNVITVVSDFGPKFNRNTARAILGDKAKLSEKALQRVRIRPFRDYAPMICRLFLRPETGTFSVLDMIALKDKAGVPLLRPLVPKDSDISTATPVDAEGVVRLADGTIWLCGETGPSLIRCAPDGRMLKRFVPEGKAGDFDNPGTEIVATLPAVLTKIQRNRGFEAITLSEDGRSLWLAVQSPLANPDEAAFEDSRTVRLFRMDLETETMAEEYAYRLDPPDTFRFDKGPKPADLRISGLAPLSGGDLLVLERTDKTTKLVRIGLTSATNILGSRWDDLKTAPSLELFDNLEAADVVPVAKQPVFDSFDDAPDGPEKFEGVAVLGDGRLALINDNDFGLGGAETRVMLLGGRFVDALR
ncbi:MAG: esterase-like activity of phytase family protein [Pseudomonadota bacterium]